MRVGAQSVTGSGRSNVVRLLNRADHYNHAVSGGLSQLNLVRVEHRAKEKSEGLSRDKQADDVSSRGEKMDRVHCIPCRAV